MSMRFSYHVNGKPALHYSEEVQEIVYEIDGRFGLSLEYDSDAGGVESGIRKAWVSHVLP